MEIKLKDVMRNSFRFLIEDEFKLELFRKAIKKERMIKNLAKKLRCPPDSIRIMRIGQTKFIKWQIVKKLAEIVGVSEEELKSRTLAIKGGMSGKITEVKFPIKESPELALLVAKGMGDGTIEKDKFRFSFWNNEETLIKEVCEYVKKAIGKTKATINKTKDRRIQAKFCPFVAFVLHKAGVPVGNKTLQDFDIPDWIKNGSKEIKTSFIRGLFDDECCVSIDEKNRNRSIIFAQGKAISLHRSLENFFNSIKKMLLEFDIKTSNITKQEVFKDKNGKEKIVLRFAIHRKENLENFLNNIGFTHPQKYLKLKKAIESFIDIHKSKKAILQVIQNSARPLSTTEISNLTGINRNLVLFHLNDIFENGKVFKSNGRNPNFWFKENIALISNKEKVLKIVKDFGPLTVRRISKLANLNDKYTFNIVKKLSKRNMITIAGKISCGKRFSSLWSLNNKKVR